MSMTGTEQSSTQSSQTGSQPPDRGSDLTPRGGSELVTEHGTTTIADSVVAKVAGLAAREIEGVHAMGGTASRAIGAIKERISSGPSASQGVKVEVGQRQAAVDLDVIVEYGVSIPDLANGIRRNVAERVETMTGLEVAEVNIAVNDVYLGDTEGDDQEPRVE